MDAQSKPGNRDTSYIFPLAIIGTMFFAIGFEVGIERLGCE